MHVQIDSETQGYISEEDFCTHVLQHLQEKDTLTQIRSLPLQDPPSFRQCPHAKVGIVLHLLLSLPLIIIHWFQAPLCRLMPASSPSRWITVSKVVIFFAHSGYRQYQIIVFILLATIGWSGE